MKCLMDIESMHTYEGSYEINSLISGRELTGGLAAFKWKFINFSFNDFVSSKLKNLDIIKS